MNREIMKSRLGNLRLYKFDVPAESDVGVILVTHGGLGNGHIGQRFRLTQFTGRGRGKGSKAGLSKSFINFVDDFFYERKDRNITNQIFNYIVSNFSFKDLEIVPPTCPVLVFHFHMREFVDDHVPQIDITTMARASRSILRIKNSVLTIEDAITRIVQIAPPTTEILDCYKSPELCCICEKGYPKEDEIVHKTKCNQIFHGTCISRYLLRTPQCPVCSAHLPPVDIRTLLFF